MGTKLTRISYHMGTKTVAFLLAVIAFGCFVTYSLNLVAETEDIGVLFAKDFISSEGAYNIFRSAGHNAQQFVMTDNPSEQQRVKTRLNAIEGIYCYSKNDDIVIANSDYTLMEEFAKHKYYYMYTSEGRLEGESALSTTIEADWVYRSFLNTSEFYFAFDDKFIEKYTKEDN